MNKLRAVALIGIGLTTLLAPVTAYAADKPAGGISVTPGIANITLKAGTAKAESDIKVTNNFQSSVAFEAELRDVDQDNGVLVPNGVSKSAMSSSIAITPRTFSLEPNASLIVHLTVYDTASLSPGGNYASLLIRQTSDVGSSVGLHAAVSVGLFITKEQGAVRRLSASTPSLPHIAFWMPNNVDLTFTNTGNVLVVPRGSLLVTHGSTTVTKAVVNDSSLSVLPKNKLVLQNQLARLQDAWLPGKYTMSLQYRFDGDLSNGTVKHYSFFYLPLQSLVLVMIVLVMISYLWPHGRKAYRHVRKRKTKVTSV